MDIKMEFNGFDNNFMLTGKNAFITGAASGIGLEIAKLFANKGANIIAFDLKHSEELKRHVQKQGVDYLELTADITDGRQAQSAVDKACAKLRKIDILINSAGVGLIEKAENMTEDMWDLTMNVNIRGLFFLTQKIGRTMIANGGGKIISIASQAGIVALDKHAAYGVSKAGIIYMTKQLGYEWGKYHIQTNAISPTIVLTPLGKKIWENEEGDAFKKEIPSGRFAYPEEIAACALFLASSGADMINGENLVIDGGYTIK